MAKQTNKFKRAVAKAKALYKTGRYKTFGDAVKSAYKKIGAVGAVSKKNRQTGRSSKKADVQRKAKAPGKRKSRTGRKYYERRKNRSDVPGKLTGVSNAQLKSVLKKRLEIKLGEQLVRKHNATSAHSYYAADKMIKQIKSELNKL